MQHAEQRAAGGAVAVGVVALAHLHADALLDAGREAQRVDQGSGLLVDLAVAVAAVAVVDAAVAVLPVARRGYLLQAVADPFPEAAIPRHAAQRHAAQLQRIVDHEGAGDGGGGEHGGVHAGGAVGPAGVAPGQGGRQPRAPGAGVAVGVGADLRPAQFVARVPVRHQVGQHRLRVVADPGQPAPGVQARRDAHRRGAGQQHPLRAERVAERQVGQPHLHHVGAREIDAVLLQDQHAEHRVVDVVVARHEADALAHRLGPAPVAVAERVQHGLGQVVANRPLAGRLGGGAQLRHGGAHLDRLAEHAAAHRAEKTRLGAPPRVVGVDRPHRVGGQVGTLGPYRVQLVRLHVRPVVPARRGVQLAVQGCQRVVALRRRRDPFAEALHHVAALGAVGDHVLQHHSQILDSRQHECHLLLVGCAGCFVVPRPLLDYGIIAGAMIFTLRSFQVERKDHAGLGSADAGLALVPRYGMLPAMLTPQQFEALREIDTPTICNAIEPFEVRRDSEGFMGWNIRCQFPDLGVMLGYAVTATVDSMTPSRELSRAPMLRLWEAVAAAPKPAVLVFKDISPRNSHACHCGDVMANTAHALGAIGLVTDGGIRDLDGVRGLGFHYFAPGMTPAHGRFQVIDVNVPVAVSEVEVVPGDLIHGDANGVVKIPLEIAADLPRAAAEVVAREQEMIDFVRGPDFSLDGLRERFGLADSSVE